MSTTVTMVLLSLASLIDVTTRIVIFVVTSLVEDMVNNACNSDNGIPFLGFLR
jgi:hypothetical protein